MGKGSRVKLTAEAAAELIPRHPDRLGTIVGESLDGTCWRVLWDGASKNSVASMHKSFIERVSSRKRPHEPV